MKEIADLTDEMNILVAQVQKLGENGSVDEAWNVHSNVEKLTVRRSERIVRFNDIRECNVLPALSAC